MKLLMASSLSFIVVTLTVSDGGSSVVAAVATDLELETRKSQTVEQLKAEYDRLVLTRGRVKAFALPIDDGGIALAKQHNVGELSRNEIERRVRGNGVEIVDSALAEKLSRSIKECKNEDPQCGSLPEEVNVISSDTLVIAGKIDRVQVTGKYRKEKSDKSDVCEFTGEVDTHVRVYSVNPVTVYKELSVIGIFSKTVNMEDPLCPSSNMSLQEELIQKAIQEAGSANESELKNLFGTRGMVFGARRDDQGKTYFQTTLPTNGLKADTSVRIYANFEMKHPFAEKAERTLKPIGEGKIVKLQDGESEAWIEVTKLEPEQEIKKGDRVQVIHEATVVEKAERLEQGANEIKKHIISVKGWLNNLQH